MRKAHNAGTRTPDAAFERTGRFVLMKWLVFWLLLTFVGFLFTGSYYVSRTAQDPEFSVFGALNAQMLRFQVWSLLAGLIILSARVFRQRFRRWKYLFPLHLAASAVWSLLAFVVFASLYWVFDLLLNGPAGDPSEVFRSGLVANLVLGIVGYKIILTTDVAIDYYTRFHAERERSARLEQQLAEARLQALKMQLQPHFLFNTLNSVSNLTLEDPRGAVRMIARLGDFLRLTIDSNGTQMVPLARELEFVRRYLEIERMRFRDRLAVEFETPAETLRAAVPNLLLQPLVENAIKHGISETPGAGRILVSSERTGERLRLFIENEGAGADAEDANGGEGLNGGGANGFGAEGVGLSNTRRRLRRHYGADFRFELEPLRKGGARAIIEIPFEEAAAETAEAQIPNAPDAAEAGDGV